jgi:hypothetical protein
MQLKVRTTLNGTEVDHAINLQIQKEDLNFITLMMFRVFWDVAPCSHVEVA